MEKTSWTQLTDMIAECNGTDPERGINWTWTHFTNGADAHRFCKWCDDTGWETRGVYGPHGDDPTFAVRFR